MVKRLTGSYLIERISVLFVSRGELIQTILQDPGKAMHVRERII